MSPDGVLAPQFVDTRQQRAAATLGMWVFIATEILFFGGMFLCYAVYRIQNPEIFLKASNHTLVLVGSINTGLLLLSSFCMVLGVRAAEAERSLATAGFLALTAFLGLSFLVIKGFEYQHEIHEGLFPGQGFQMPDADVRTARMFFYLYFLMTGVHALHVLIGVILLGLFALRAVFTSHPERMVTAVDLLGLYWHLVDLVWVFLFPLLYLVGRST